MNILITGATGFLGCHLLPELIKKGYEVLILKRSFSNVCRIERYLSQVKKYDIDKEDVNRVFQDNKIDVIIHLATDYGKGNKNNVELVLEANIKLPSVLLDLGVKYGAKVFINADTSTDSRYSLYSATNKAFGTIGKFFASNYEITFVNMVLQYMYGEKDDDSKFVPFMIKNILSGNEIKATKGEQRRDFIYVKDVVNACLAVLVNIVNFNKNYMEFNIGTGQSISLRDFAKAVEKVAGKKGRVNWGAIPYRKNEIFDLKADIEETKNVLNWRPEYALGKGLKKTISWYTKRIWNA